MNSPETEAKLRPYLPEGETLLWYGRPDGRVRFRVSDILMVPFSLLWCGFAVFWETMVIVMDAPLLFKIWGIPFVLVGLYMLVGRFFWDAWKRRRSVYGITSHFVILYGETPKPQAILLTLKEMSSINLTVHKDGTGTIHLGPTNAAMMYASVYRNTTNTPPGHFLEYIEQPQQVFQLLQSLQAAPQNLHLS